jgi:amino acid transporter
VSRVLLAVHSTVDSLSTYLRFRAGLKSQNLLHTGFLPVKGYWLLVWSPIVLFFRQVFPSSLRSLHALIPHSGYYCFLPGAFNAADFIFAYGSVFIFLAILVGSKTWNIVVRKGAKRMWIPASEIDFVSNVREIEMLTEAAEEKRAGKPRTWGQRISDFFF